MTNLRICFVANGSMAFLTIRQEKNQNLSRDQKMVY